MPSHPSGAKLCPKGRATPELIYHQDRITQPMRRTSPKGAPNPTWAPISWDEAMGEIAARMTDIRAEHGAEQVAFSVTTPSGTSISDGISWIERLIRAYGSPNTIYGTEICNWHKDVASRFTYGWDIGTPDFANTDCAVLWGNNPAATWLARSVEVQKAVKRGASLIVVDPRPTLFARRADCWLKVRPGTDQALALGLARQLIADGGIDTSFLQSWSNGPFLVRADTGRFLRQSDLEANVRDDVLLAAGRDGALLRYQASQGRWLDDPADVALDIRTSVTGIEGEIACRSAFGLFADAAAPLTPERVEEITGVPPEMLKRAAKLLAGSRSVAYYAWNGVGQSITATQTDRAISILYGLTGSYGGKGGNVPGGAAAFANLSGDELLGASQRAKALGLDERPLGPGRSAWVTARDVYRAVLDRKPYPVRMLFAFGTNLLSSQPDTAKARAALEQLEFHVHADFFLNPTAAYADIFLPVCTSWEREGLRTGFDASLDGQRRVQLRPAVIDPIGDSRSDTDIVLDLARRLGHEDDFFGCDADRGHDHVLAPAGLSVTRLRENPEGVDLATTVPYRAFAAGDEGGTAKGFPTPTKRLEIYSEQFHEFGYAPVPELPETISAVTDPQFPLRLSSAKTVAFCHSQHRNLASLRRLMPDPVLEMPEAAAQARGIAANDWVRVRTRAGSFVARCAVVKDLEAGSVFSQHGWWAEGPEGSPYDASHPLAANFNQAIDTSVSDPISGSIPLRCSACEVEKVERPGPAD